MRTSSRLLASLASLALAACSKAPPGDPGDPGATGASATSAPDRAEPDTWVDVRSTAGNFTVRMPQRPTEATTPTQTAVGMMDNHIFMVESGSRAYMVSFGDVPAMGADKLRDPRAQKALLASAKDNWVGQVRNGTIGDEKPFEVGPFQGTEVTVTGTMEGVTGKVAIVVRTLLVNERLYQSGVLMLASEPYADEAAKLFASFALIEMPAKKTLPPIVWKEFVSAEGRFAALFPGTPADASEKTPPAARGATGAPEAGDAGLHSLKATDPTTNIVVMVGYADLPAGTVTPENTKAILDGGRDSSVAAVRGTLRSEKDVTLGAFPGRELVVEAPVPDPTVQGALVRARAYLVKDRLYYIQVIRERPSDPAAPEPELVQKALDSFRIVTPAP